MEGLAALWSQYGLALAFCLVVSVSSRRRLIRWFFMTAILAIGAIAFGHWLLQLVGIVFQVLFATLEDVGQAGADKLTEAWNALKGVFGAAPTPIHRREAPDYWALVRTEPFWMMIWCGIAFPCRVLWEIVIEMRKRSQLWDKLWNDPV